MKKGSKKVSRERRGKKLGRIEQKILLLLATGVSLALTHRPDQYFSIVRSARKEWKRINDRSLREAVKRLYNSRLIDCKEEENGTITLTLDDNGRERIVQYNFDTMKVKRGSVWDGLWRMVIFDIPEEKKKARDALSAKLNRIGMIPIQKSVFIHPFDCKDEIEFVSEFFRVKPHIRYILVKDIDIDLELRHKFNLT